MLFLENRMEFAEGFENRALGREIEVFVLGEKALEHELMRGAAAQANIGPLMVDDLVVRAVELGRKPRISEGRQRIGGDGDFVVLADDD